MKLKKIHWIGIVFCCIIILINFIFFNEPKDSNLFLFLIGIAVAIGVLPFIIEITLENKEEEQMSEMFLEFARNLAESVGTGTPVSRSIVNMKDKSYGPLSPHIEKLANQISIGIPVGKAFQTFAYEVDNPVISRAVTLISEAEKAGGEIDYILESSAKSIAEVEKLKKERKSSIYSLVVQGYIIFFIFIGIMLVMEFKIIPLTSGIGDLDIGGNVNNIGNSPKKTTGEVYSPERLSSPFLYLLLAQGFFAGLIIGKLTEGSIKAGVKHSFFLTMTSFLVSTGVRLAVG